MAFQMDLSRELLSLLAIKEDLFSEMSEQPSTRFFDVVLESSLKKKPQRLERIPKKARQNNQFAVNVWVTWATNRNSRSDLLYCPCDLPNHQA
jgi:hypothetical protein